MSSGFETIDAVTTLLRTPIRAVRRGLERGDDQVDRWIDELSTRGRAAYVVGVGTAIGTAGVYLTSVLSPLIIGRVAAQSAGQAEEIMCQTGAGNAITLLFGGFALLMLVVAAMRLMSGLNKKGSQRSDKKREGDEQLKGAGYSVGGVFALTAFPLILEQIGLATISCVQFAPF